MKKKKTIVVALGGNAISHQFEEGNIHQQFANTRQSLNGVVQLIAEGYQVLVTHGNGPQVGNALIRVEESRHLVPVLPLGVIVADTEGGMGYMVEQCLQNKLHDRNITREIATIITQILVDPEDPSITNPTKFVGPIYSEDKVEELRKRPGWILKEDKGRGWRRVVPSPIPKEIVGKKVIRLLLDNDILVIAAGGGGIPVYINQKNGWYEGIDAVIDKDLASAVLARDVLAEELLIITAVEKVALNWGKPDQTFLDRITLAEARNYLAEGHFPSGSMGPKIQAAINFLEAGGEKVTITSIEKSVEAVKDGGGTIIVP
ncbi:MAG: carbamate kinase [bacterium]|nr:MAG: carbamate kinase [bacterium]